MTTPLMHATNRTVQSPANQCANNELLRGRVDVCAFHCGVVEGDSGGSDASGGNSCRGCSSEDTRSSTRTTGTSTSSSARSGTRTSSLAQSSRGAIQSTFRYLGTKLGEKSGQVIWGTFNTLGHYKCRYVSKFQM